MKVRGFIYAENMNRILAVLCFFDGYKCQIGDSGYWGISAPTLEIPPLHYDRRPVGAFIFARSSFGESNRVYEAHGVVLYILVVTKHIDQVLQPCLGVVGRAI